MRLKGGKLLLDLSSLGDMPTDQQLLVYLLSYEEKKCIIEKGLTLKISLDNHIIVFEPLLQGFDGDGVINFYPLTTSEGDSVAIYIDADNYLTLEQL